MQISRRFLCFSLTATLISPLALWAQDSKTAKPAAAPAAIVVASTSMSDPQDDDKIQEALHKKINELDAQKPAAPPPPPPPPPTEPKKKPEPVKKAEPAKKTEPVYMPLPGSNSPPAKVVAEPKKVEPKNVEAQTASSTPQSGSRDAEIAAAVALANADQAKADKAAKANQAMAKPGPPQKSSPGSASRAPMVLPVVSGPPSSLSGSQQAQLLSLDQQYLSDQLTSEQYHAKRAKIISAH